MTALSRHLHAQASVSRTPAQVLVCVQGSFPTTCTHPTNQSRLHNSKALQLRRDGCERHVVGSTSRRHVAPLQCPHARFAKPHGLAFCMLNAQQGSVRLAGGLCASIKWQVM